jgi:hypothetical protein
MIMVLKNRVVKAGRELLRVLARFPGGDKSLISSIPAVTLLAHRDLLP